MLPKLKTNLSTTTTKMFNTSVDSILATFTKTIDKLKAHEAASYSRGTDLNERASALREEAARHTEEAFKARAMAEKLKAIFASTD